MKNSRARGVNNVRVLNEYKEIYKQAAELIPNWKEIPQLELAKKCAEHDSLYQSYLSALILKFWHIVDRNLYRDKGLYAETEAYDWYINAIMVVINSKPWDDPKSSVYNDPKAVEKILNTCVNCDRANWFQASNRNKRKINHGIGSLDLLSEEYGDSFTPDYLKEEVDYESYKELVVSYFKKQQYLMAMVIDVIANDIQADSITNDKMLINLVRKSIRTLPDNYVKHFANNYELDVESVEKAFQIVNSMSDTKLRSSIENYIYTLRTKLKRDN